MRTVVFGQFAMSPLPEELIQLVVEYIVSNPAIAMPQLLEHHWKHSRTRLLSLSLTNHQFRRICMPFLFAYVEVRGAYGDLEKLKTHCVLNESFALSIRTIDYYCYSPGQIDIVHHLLHRLMNLSQVILNDGVLVDMPLLDLLSQQHIQNVVIASWKSLPSKYLSQLGPSSLSKITLDSIKLYTEGVEHELANYIHYGMQIRCLTVPPKLLVPVHNSFSTRSFSGLIELELWLNLIPELSWLPEFIYTHPLLRRIRFSMSRVQWNIDRAVPFILPFLNAIDEEGLVDTFEFKAFSIARSNSAAFLSSTESLRGWHVAGLWFCISEWSSRRLLQLAHTFFPQISTLTIESPLPGSDSASISADEVIGCLSRFSSLRTVNLVYLFRNLKFGDLETYQSPQTFATAKRYHGHLGIRTSPSHVQTDRAAEIEAALIWYTSCIAQRIPTIESFLIQEPPLRGWIHVNKGGISGSLRSLMQSEVNQLFSLYV
ncbi:MAG: hypothetical protein NXY57DRAFT_1019486 [Lentinula lateritia]|nr:MAG: hypothetical protein NXY57DRAFT_1019486 [Lentinula lateritia]